MPCQKLKLLEQKCWWQWGTNDTFAQCWRACRLVSLLWEIRRKRCAHPVAQWLYPSLQTLDTCKSVEFWAVHNGRKRKPIWMSIGGQMDNYIVVYSYISQQWDGMEYYTTMKNHTHALELGWNLEHNAEGGHYTTYKYSNSLYMKLQICRTKRMLFTHTHL